jgi:pilus assembly protein CpaD
MMTGFDRHTEPRRVGRAALLALAGAALMLAGCNQHRGDVTASIPTDYRLRHPIVVKEQPRMLELFVGSRRGGLTAEQRAEVLAFAQAWTREGTGGVIIEVPAATPNERPAAESVEEARAILAAAGVPAVEVRPYRPANPKALASVRVSYPRMTAEAGPCGLWPDDVGPTLDNSAYMQNRTHWNHGCSSQRNLAAMVTNPADLVQPRAETPVYTARRTTVLEKYRKGEGTATNAGASDSKGKISDIGQ